MARVSRINISVPNELYARMYAVREWVSWSEVARAAFEGKLEALAAKRRQAWIDKILEAAAAEPVEIGRRGPLLSVLTLHVDQRGGRDDDPA